MLGRVLLEASCLCYHVTLESILSLFGHFHVENLKNIYSSFKNAMGPKLGFFVDISFHSFD